MCSTSTSAEWLEELSYSRSTKLWGTQRTWCICWESPFQDPQTSLSTTFASEHSFFCPTSYLFHILAFSIFFSGNPASMCTLEPTGQCFRPFGFMHFARTPRDRARLWAPRSVRYGREYGLVLLMFMITLGYSVISPIIVPIALIYFLMAWLVWRYTSLQHWNCLNDWCSCCRYQILYVYVRKYESGARMWPLFVKRTIFSLWLFQFLTSCVLLTKEAYWQAALLWVTVPVILHRFNT